MSYSDMYWSFPSVQIVLIVYGLLTLVACENRGSKNYTHTSTLPKTTGNRVYGWVDQPNGRGSIDIIWTCLFTIFLAGYTILTLNVPSRGESWWSITGRRLTWMGVSIIGPEFVLTAAAGQRAAASRSVKDFQSLGCNAWTMRHAFFADMGGIELHPNNGTPFRINAKHFHYLVEKGYLPMPDIPLDEIWDKSKQDTIAKSVTALQIAYMIIQCVGRAMQHLVLTTLELFTLAIVVCSIATSWCWLHKPMDVKLPMKIYMDHTIDDVLVHAASSAAKPYRQTPMDFVDDLKPSWSLNIQTFVHMPIGPFGRPISRFGNDRFPWLELPQSTLLSVATMIYAAIHVAAWNWRFPSRLELLLWRASSMVILGSTVAFWVLETIAVWYRYNGGDILLQNLLKLKQGKTEAREDGPIENTQDKQLPLKSEFWSMLILALIYGSARVFLLFEAFYGLRSLEESAYITVSWSQFIPHV